MGHLVIPLNCKNTFILLTFNYLEFPALERESLANAFSYFNALTPSLQQGEWGEGGLAYLFGKGRISFVSLHEAGGGHSGLFSSNICHNFENNLH